MNLCQKYFSFALAVALLPLFISAIPVTAQNPEKDYVKQAVKEKSIEKLDYVVSFEKELYPELGNGIIPAFRNFISCEEFYVISFLVERGYLLFDSELSKGWTPLTLACLCNEVGFVKNSFESGIHIDSVCQLQITPLLVASERGNLLLTEYLSEKIPENLYCRDSMGRTSLHYAAESNNIKLVKFLLKKGVNPDEIDILHEKAVYYAASNRNLKLVKLLFARQKSPLDTTQSFNLLSISVRLGHYPQFRYLLRKGIGDINSRDAFGRSILFDAIAHAMFLEENEIGFISKRHKKKAQIWKKEAQKNFDCLISLGVDINAKDDSGQTILFKIKENFNLVRFLMERKIDVNIRDKFGKSVLDYLIETILYPRLTIVFGQPVNLNTGFLGESEMLKAIKLLDENNAEASFPYRSGISRLLHQAVKLESKELVEFLIASGIDVNSTDLMGRTALDIAINSGNESIITILKNINALKGNGHNSSN